MVKPTQNPEAPKFFIVDGQQRITTLVIFLKSLQLALSSSSNDEEKGYSDTLGSYFVDRNNTNIVLLQTNHDTSNIFDHFIRDNPYNNVPRTHAEKNIIDAISECKKFISEWSKSKNLIELYNITLHRIFIVLNIVKDNKIVYTVFEVLNSRGLDVSVIDKAKSILMSNIFTLQYLNSINQQQSLNYQNKQHRTWGNIYEQLGLREISGDEIIRFSVALFDSNQTKSLPSANESIYIIKKNTSSCYNDIENLSNLIERVTSALGVLNDNKSLKGVTKVMHVRFLWLSLYLRVQDEQININDQYVQNLFRQWENISFRIFGLGMRDARSKPGGFYQLAQQIYHKRINTDSHPVVFPFTDILDKIKDIDSSGEYTPDRVSTNILNKDLYESNNWKTELVYMLYNYELYNAEKKGLKKSPINNAIWKEVFSSTPDNSIEHIFPQNENAAGWGKCPGLQHHRLGNLTILQKDLNSDCSDKPFNEKKNYYRRSSFLINQDIADKNDWGLKEIEYRENEILAWAKLRWADV